MAGEVGCFVSGCTEPVVGQCTGYGDACLKFFCANHSVDTLCSNCAERKANDEELQRVYDDYLRTAESIKRPGLGTWLLALVICSVLGGILVGSVRDMMISGGNSSFVLGCVPILPSILGVSIIVWLDDRAMSRASQISKTKPGFDKFYKVWRWKKDKQELLTAAGLGLSAAAGAYGAHKSQQLRRDVREIKEKL